MVFFKNVFVILFSGILVNRPHSTVLRWMHLIEEALDDFDQGRRHQVSTHVDNCFDKIKHRYQGATWIQYLSCNNIDDESKLQLILILANIQVNKLTQHEAEEANRKMKENNGGVYFKIGK